jgi:hypothetical protein
MKGTWYIDLQVTWNKVPRRHFFPLIDGPLIEVLLYIGVVERCKCADLGPGLPGPVDSSACS